MLGSGALLLEAGEGMADIVRPNLAPKLKLNEDMREEDPLAVPALNRARSTVLPHPIEIAAWRPHYDAPRAYPCTLQGACDHGRVNCAAPVIDGRDLARDVTAAALEPPDQEEHRARLFDAGAARILGSSIQP